MSPARLLLISGSLRKGSTNSALLRTAVELRIDTLDVRTYEGTADLPAFNPDADGALLPLEAADLRQQIWEADALLFSTPEYAGGLPGSFKNLLDWTVGDDRPGSMYEKRVAWVNVSSRGASDAHESLRRVLGYVGARIVTSACADIAVTNAMVNDDGLVEDLSVRRRLTEVLQVLAEASST